MKLFQFLSFILLLFISNKINSQTQPLFVDYSAQTSNLSQAQLAEYQRILTHQELINLKLCKITNLGQFVANNTVTIDLSIIGKGMVTFTNKTQSNDEFGNIYWFGYTIVNGIEENELMVIKKDGNTQIELQIGEEMYSTSFVGDDYFVLGRQENDNAEETNFCSVQVPQAKMAAGVESSPSDISSNRITSCPPVG